MSYQMDWLVPHKVIYARIVGDTDIELTRQVNENFIRLLDEGLAPVHILANLGYVEKTPLNILEIRNHQTYMSHPSLGWVVIYTPSAFLRFTASVLGQVTRFNLKMADSEAEGLEFLKDMTQTNIDWRQARLELLQKNEAP